MRIYRGLMSLAEGFSSLKKKNLCLNVQRPGDEMLIPASRVLGEEQARTQRTELSLVLVFRNNKELLKKKALFESSGPSILSYPDSDLWGGDRWQNHRENEIARLNTLIYLQRADRGPFILLTTEMAFFRLTLARHVMTKDCFCLRKEDLAEPDEIAEKLRAAGYQESIQASEAGLYSLRGGILDINSPGDGPVRVEFLGDEVFSLRSFDPESGRSGALLHQICPGPAHELIHRGPEQLKNWCQDLHMELIRQEVPDRERQSMCDSLAAGIRFSGFSHFVPLFLAEDERGTLRDYLPEQCLLVCFEGQEQSWQNCQDHMSQAEIAWEEDRKLLHPCLHPARFYADFTRTSGLREVRFLNEGQGDADSCHLGWQGMKNSDIPDIRGIKDFGQWFERQSLFLEEHNERIILLFPELRELQEFAGLLKHRGFDVAEPTGFQQFARSLLKGRLDSSAISLVVGGCSGFFSDPESGLIFIPSDLLRHRSGHRQVSPKKQLRQLLERFQDLRPGDLVVHEIHGIGRYEGMQHLSGHSLSGEFLKISYHGGDSVFLPVSGIALIQKFHTAGENSVDRKSVALDRLGGRGFQEKKARTAKSIQVLAEDLLKQDALRRLSKRPPCPAPDDIYHHFVADFPWEETEDQLRAIEEISADLESPVPMDRILIGDVGFGKTEVALRACMRVITAGYQVLFLVPTTILCYQHHRNFINRLSVYGVRVDAINRFVKGSQAAGILASLNSGKTDILIGTHRLLGKDVQPARLGLMIIDEEHRFGVAHKEKLKKIRQGADLLTLTATPIPRTLHMAMIGLRDLSLLNQPPLGRQRIRTMLARPDDEVIRNAILNETSRDGQVFCLFNRIQGIDNMCRRIRELIPGISVDMAHGQMNPQLLEDTMIRFIGQKFQVLVCTTIIESGIDMPNVNTILIFDADKLGLAQLHQLRGRVGRSGVQAWAWLLSQHGASGDEARRRLETLAAWQEPGSGFQISSADLDIRGAGNVLGGEQSGHIHTIGYEMYSRLLEQEISLRRGEQTDDLPEPEIRMQSAARIPDSYIKDSGERLRYYRRLFALEYESEMTDLFEELRDKFGAVPDELYELKSLALIRLCLKKLRVYKVVLKRKGLWEAFLVKAGERLLGNLHQAVTGTSFPELSLSREFSLLIRAETPEHLAEVLERLVALVCPRQNADAERGAEGV